MSESERPIWGLATAGEAGLVASLFLVASDNAAPGGNLDELGGGRVVRELLEMVVVLRVVAAFGFVGLVALGVTAAFCFVGLVVLGVVAAFGAPFVGLFVPLRVSGTFFSASLELPNADRRFVLDIVFLGPVALLNDGDTPTTRFTGLEPAGSLFSPSGLTIGFLVSSTGPVDNLDL